jgi:hypothetical protein
MRPALVALGLAVVAASSALAQEQPRPSDFDAELSALEKDYKQAHEEFTKPLREAKTDQERQKVQLDYRKAPESVLLPKFRDLARRARGTDAGLRATSWSIGLGLTPGQAPTPEFRSSIDDVAAYADSPRLAEPLCQRRLWLAAQMGARDEVVRALETVASKSPHRLVRATSLSTLADVHAALGEKAEARALWERLATEFADLPVATRARALIAAAEDLVLGKVAPDFEATDQDGKKFKLSDYRGKVVVLDFWGFW